MNVLLAGQKQEGFSTALAQALDAVSSPLVVKDSALLGRPRNELIGCTDSDVWPSEWVDRLRAPDHGGEPR